MKSWESNSGLCACKAGIPPIYLDPQPHTVDIFSIAAGTFRNGLFPFFKVFQIQKPCLITIPSFLTSKSVTAFCFCTDLVRPSCASGWFYYKSHCYGYFRKMENWSHAEVRSLSCWFLLEKGAS